jgi:ATP-binding cassette, subfamily B, bacterial
VTGAVESSRLTVGEAARVFARALRFVAPFRRRFAVKLLLTIGATVPILLLPWPTKIIIDHVVDGLPIAAGAANHPFFVRPLLSALETASPGRILAAMVAVQAGLIVLVGAFGATARERDEVDGSLANGQDTATQSENEANAGFTLAGGLYGLFDFSYTIRLTQAFNHHYRTRLFERIQSLPMSAFDDERIGDAMYRVLYDTAAITNACYRILLTPVASVVFILATAWVLALTFGSHPALVWSALAFAPVVLVMTYPFASLVRWRSGESREAGATTTATVDEGISNIVAVQSLGGEERERDRFDRDSAASFRRFRRFRLAGMGAFLAAAAPLTIAVGWAWLYIADLAIAGEITLGDFALLLTYYFGLVLPAIGLGALWIDIQSSAAGLQRVFFLMDQPGEVDVDGAVPLSRVSERVRLEDVSHRYADGTRALDGVTLELRRGTVTAVVGPAGAGKTTLAYLLPRFLTPQGGRVTFDGTDVATARLDDVRRQVAFVFQESTLFDDTVGGNIRVGRPDASDEEVRAAARAAGADEFICELPDGYDTPLGRMGGRLSVGQKQRLAIARALVRDAPIVILDEPTSALDAETAQRLIAALREAGRDRFVLVIAHRLAVARVADQIAFVDGGRIVERGTHDELMRSEIGVYRRFVELQTLAPPANTLDGSA